MDRLSIEKLALWLVIALVIQYLVGQGASFYIQAQQDSAATDAERIHAMAQAMNYKEAYQIIVGLLVNAVISFWLYQQATTKKYLWAVLGFSAKWWALPIFAWWLYAGSQSKNT